MEEEQCKRGSYQEDSLFWKGMLWEIKHTYVDVLPKKKEI